ncbi:hypothetical protein T11_493, partial [Trichinella zimbabwensis]
RRENGINKQTKPFLQSILIDQANDHVQAAWWNECLYTVCVCVCVCVCLCMRKLVEKIVTCHHHHHHLYRILYCIVCRSIVHSTVCQFGTSGMCDLTQQLATRPCLKMCVPIISHRPSSSSLCVVVIQSYVCACVYVCMLCTYM